MKRIDLRFFLEVQIQINQGSNTPRSCDKRQEGQQKFTG